MTLVGNLAIGAVLLYGGLRVIDHQMQVGVLVTFLLYLQRFFDPLVDLSQFYSNFQSAGAALEKISGVLEEPPSVPEPADPVALPGRCAATRRGRSAALRVGPVRLPGARSCCRDLNLHHPGRPDRRASSAPPARARPPSPGCWPGCTTRNEGRVLLDGVDLRQLSERRPCATRSS